MPRAGAVPPIAYAKSDGTNIAYQVFGQGPATIVLVPGFISHIEFAWREPSLARFLRKLSSYARVVAFDKRGMGLSDRSSSDATPNLRQRRDDIEAVMNAIDAPSAVLLAWSEGGPTAMSFAKTRAERCEGLVLIGTSSSFVRSQAVPSAIPRALLETFIEVIEEGWGTGVAFELYAPSLVADGRARDWWASYQRLACSPGAVAASLRLHLEVDVHEALPHIHAPTLVVHQTEDMVIPVECGRALSEQIPDAHLLERTGSDHLYWLGDQDESLLAIRVLLGRTRFAPGLPTRQARRPPRPKSGWESITDSEMDVVRLLVTGYTNREIGHRLHLSSRTVETHVAHVMQKLGHGRRTEIAAEGSRRGL